MNLRLIIAVFIILTMAMHTVRAQTDTTGVGGGQTQADTITIVADTPRNTPVDGFYKYDAFKGAEPVPLPKVNMNSVRFYKRVYRDIDLQDPANAIFIMPGESLIEIILEGMKEGKITAYDAASTPENPTGDAFTTPLAYDQAMSKLTDSVLVPFFDNEGNQIGAEMKLNEFNPATVTKFRVKEDIFYDNQRSKIETRIVGLAPLKRIEVEGELLNEQPVFWLYFPQCREVFVTKEVSDPQRNIFNTSFDDIFIQHSFNSQIVKEANPADEKAQNPDKIEKQIQDYKKDTWKY